MRASIALLAIMATGLMACTAAPPGSSADTRRDVPGAVWESAANVEELGWAPPKVAALEGRVKAVGSAAFMIVTRGKIVAAWGDTARTYWSHSVRKSLLSALIGQAVSEGKIDPERTLEIGRASCRERV